MFLCFYCAVTEFNFDSLCKALAKLSDLENEANLRVGRSGVLKGLHMDDIKWAGEHVKFQDGCLEFFKKIEKSEDVAAIDAHILSYCWSGDLIRSAFRSGLCIYKVICLYLTLSLIRSICLFLVLIQGRYFNPFA